MKVALVHEHFREDHLAEVVEEMQTRGAPTIRAVWMPVYGHWAALEGCHRLRAAAVLGLVPEIEEVEYSADPPPPGCAVEAHGRELTIEEIAGSSHDSVVIEFDD